MSELSTLPLADTSDMAQLHRVFRHAVDGGQRLIGPVQPNDQARAEYVATYYDNVLRLLHAHHDGEDELMTPLLAERGTIEEAAEVRRVAGQHQTVLTDLTTAEARLTDWRAEPSPAASAALLAALAQLRQSLTAHLNEEETVVVPIAARYLNVMEWGRLPEHAMKNFTGDKMWLILGLVQEQMRPEQIAAMEAHMPPPVLEFWTGTGRRMFTDYIAGLRG